MRNITYLFYLFKIMLNLWLWWNLILAVVEYQNNKTETLIRSLFAIICLLIMILIGISNIAVG